MEEKESLFSRFASKISLKAFIIMVLCALLVLGLMVCALVSVISAWVNRENEVNLFSQGLLAVQDADEKWGYLNEKGDLAIECQFDGARPFNEKGRAVVEQDDAYFFINKKGERVDSTSFAYVGSFADNGLAKAGKESAGGDKYGYVNEKGEVKIDFLYENCSAFSQSGYAAVKLGGLWGVIDKNGDTVLEIQYAKVEISYTEDRFFVTNAAGDFAMLNARGKELIPFGAYYDYTDFSEGLMAVSRINASGATMYGFVNLRGKEVIPCTFLLGGGSSASTQFKNGYCGVYSAEKDAWTYINKKGELLGEYLYSSVLPFTEDKLAAVAKLDAEGKELWGYIDPKGRTKIEFQFSDALNFNDDGWATVEADDKYGIINEKGKYLLAPTYRGIAPAAVDGKHISVYNDDGIWAQINRKGKILRDFIAYAQLYTFSDGFSLVQNEKGAYGILNKKGAVMVACTYEEVSFDEDALYRVLIGESSWS